ncbi:MAG: hypothetical protein A2W22_03465 [Candidatus Levybacteria bacterium RBG_16_35_11]|nr:MAG: hypothetical protein A2W22_03465 [Candidatus Levybacteria bacterium RBG_16_35_11]
MKKILNPFFEFSSFLFPYALVVYLILFLLENVFSGFVSRITDLNYFLIPVIFFGLLAAFGPGQKETEDKIRAPTKWGLILIGGLTILSFVILVYKTSDLGLIGFVVSFVGSVFILFMSLIIVVFPYLEKRAHFSETRKERFSYKKFLLSPIGISLTGFIILLVAGGLGYYIYQGSVNPSVRVNSQKSEVIVQQPRVEIPNQELLDETEILVQNGSGKTGQAASMAAFLADFAFGDIKTGDADKSDYKNAYLIFNPSDLKVASYITFLLNDNDKYKIVNMLPPSNSSQSGIILILGNP